MSTKAEETRSDVTTDVGTDAKIVNGVNVTQLFETINAIKETPGIAKFKFQLSNKWLGQGHNRSEIKKFYGAMEDLEHKSTFVLDADEPPLLLGEDKGPNPVEYLLEAVTACVTTAIVYHAAARGIQIRELESEVDGDIDLHGFLGIRDDVRPGYQAIRMNFRIKADCSDEELEELMAVAPNLSPSFNSVTQGVPITVNAVRK